MKSKLDSFSYFLLCNHVFLSFSLWHEVIDLTDSVN